MQVISENLKGEHSFRGIGIVVIEGIDYAICGSRKLNFGDGQRTKYVGEMIRRVDAEPDRIGHVRVVISGVGTSGEGLPVLTENNTGKVILFSGEIEGVPLGGEIDQLNVGSFQIHPGFKLIGYKGASFETYELSSGDTGTFLPAETLYGPYFYLTLSER